MSFIQVYNLVYKDVFNVSFIYVFNPVIQNCFRAFSTAFVLVRGKNI